MSEAPQAQAKLAGVVQRMLQIRARLDEEKAKYQEATAKLNDMYEKGEAFLRLHLQESGEDGFKINGLATVYTSTRLKASVGDREAFKNFVLDTDGGIELMDIRVNTTNLKEYMAQHDGAVPPGVTAHTERTLNIRRA